MTSRRRIERNLLALTGSRVISRAFRGWQVARPIDSNEYVPCELCSTRFLRGAFVRHEKLKPEIAVGGECLSHLLAGTFLSKRMKTYNRESLKSDLSYKYIHVSRLVKYGDWIKWMDQNIGGSGLEGEWLYVVHTGKSRTGSDLKKLIKYHDDSRQYPIESLLSMELCQIYRGNLGDTISLNEFRRFDSNRDVRLERAASGRKKVDAHSEFRQRFVETIPEVSAAWAELSQVGRRAVVAILECEESGRLAGEREGVSRIFESLPKISRPIPGMFFWTPKGGLGFIELGGEEEYAYLPGQAWMLSSQTYKDVKYRYCVSVDSMTEVSVRAIEGIAFGLSVSSEGRALLKKSRV